VKKQPADLAQEQLDAYNRRDLDAFLRVYSDDIEIYDFPNRLRSRGKEAMRARYGEMFARAPDLHCELVNRIVMGKNVADHERITGRPEGLIEAMVLFTMRDGLIVRADMMVQVQSK